MIFTNGLIATQYVSIDKYFFWVAAVSDTTTLKASQRPRMNLNKEIHLRIFLCNELTWISIDTVKLFCISKKSFWKIDLVGPKARTSIFKKSVPKMRNFNQCWFWSYKVWPCRHAMIFFTLGHNFWFKFVLGHCGMIIFCATTLIRIGICTSVRRHCWRALYPH